MSKLEKYCVKHVGNPLFFVTRIILKKSARYEKKCFSQLVAQITVISNSLFCKAFYYFIVHLFDMSESYETFFSCFFTTYCKLYNFLNLFIFYKTTQLVISVGSSSMEMLLLYLFLLFVYSTED